MNLTRFKNLDWSIVITVNLSVVIGVLCAFAAKALLLAIQFLQAQLPPLALLSQQYGIGNAHLNLWNMITLVIAGLVIGLLTHYLMPNRQNRGLSHVIEDVHFNHGQTGVKEGLGVGLISAISIGAGASVGRYGPAVHLGAATASAIGKLFKLDKQTQLTLSCAGIAGAISASFLAPLAAVIFVQEVVLRQWRVYQFIPLAAAAVAGSETAELLDVQFIILSELIPDHIPPHEFIFFGIIGVLSALLAISFNHALPFFSQWIEKNIRIGQRLQPAVGGFLIACVGFFYPAVLGLGEFETQLAVAGNITFNLCITLLFLKFIATVLSLAFGFNGGVFGPSLFMGAMLGAAVGIAVEGLGISISSISIYAVVGMAATVASVIGAIFAAIIAMIEMTGEVSTSLPLLFAVSSAYLVMYLFSQASLLINQLDQRKRNPFSNDLDTNNKYEGYLPKP